MARVTSDARIRLLRKAAAPAGWFPFPPAQDAAGLKLLSLPVTPAWQIPSSATSQSPGVQVPTQFPDAALAFPPPPATFERGKRGREGEAVPTPRACQAPGKQSREEN